MVCICVLLWLSRRLVNGTSFLLRSAEQQRLPGAQRCELRSAAALSAALPGQLGAAPPPPATRLPPSVRGHERRKKQRTDEEKLHGHCVSERLEAD